MSRRMRQRQDAMQAKWADAYSPPEDDEPEPMDGDYPPDQDGEAERVQHEQQ